MILEQAITAIPDDVDVKALIDLSEFTWNDDKKLFDMLSPLKEQSYPDNCRIVFYHSQPLVKTFDELPRDMLIKLQEMLAKLDIPNYFCLIISDSIIKDDLEYVSQHYAVNEQPINHICLK